MKVNKFRMFLLVMCLLTGNNAFLVWALLLMLFEQ